MVDASQSLAPQLGLSAAGDDNINDNGCNAKFHAIFDSITGGWQEAYPPMLRKGFAYIRKGFVIFEKVLHSICCKGFNK